MNERDSEPQPAVGEYEERLNTSPPGENHGRRSEFSQRELRTIGYILYGVLFKESLEQLKDTHQVGHRKDIQCVSGELYLDYFSQNVGGTLNTKRMKRLMNTASVELAAAHLPQLLNAREQLAAEGKSNAFLEREIRVFSEVAQSGITAPVIYHQTVANWAVHFSGQVPLPYKLATLPDIDFIRELR